MNALEIRDLAKHYTGFSLDHLNLTLPWGCIMGLVGENGAGKSTTIKLILNTVSRDGGTITILGRDNRENLCLSKEEIGVVLDEVGISACLTARQIGKIMQGIYRSWDDAVFTDYLTRLAVPADKKFKEFSRGMKMKLGIAVALSHHPRLLILDEATSGLDPVVRDEVMDIFNEFTRDENHAILISSHIVSDLEKICDYIAFLHKGELMRGKRPAEGGIRSSPLLRPGRGSHSRFRHRRQAGVTPWLRASGEAVRSSRKSHVQPGGH